MKLFLSGAVAFIGYFASNTGATEDSELCKGICNAEETECVFHVSLDIHASETGYYKFNDCPGLQPTLGLKANVKYIFDQSNVTNWFHPLGFAYGPDGVYADNVELEKNATDPVSTDFSCQEDASCQHPQYTLNGEALFSDPDDELDFGLDEYEGVWFHGGRDDWIGAGNFSVNLTITDAATTEIFYFCHIHNQMAGRIKVLNADGQQRNKQDLIEIPYEYHKLEQFDSDCGTFNVSQFRTRDGAACSGISFLCGDDTESGFGQCMNAVDCSMHEGMRTTFLNKDPTTTFMHQMISHHQNAVNMAKILLRLNPPSLRCGTAYDGRRRLQTDFDEEFCHDGNDDGNAPAETLLWDIINGQNAQITFMRAWLEDNLQDSHDYCSAEPPFPKKAIVTVGVLSAVSVLSIAGVVYLTVKKPKQAEEQKKPEAEAKIVAADAAEKTI